MRNLFKRARRNAPSIVFIDELDALGTHGVVGGDCAAVPTSHVLLPRKKPRWCEHA